MADDFGHRRAHVMAKRPAIGEPEHEHLVAAGTRDPEMALRGADGARRWRKLELQAQERSARHRVPHLELAQEPEQDLVPLEPDGELDGAARIERGGGQAAPCGPYDRDLLGVE